MVKTLEEVLPVEVPGGLEGNEVFLFLAKETIDSGKGETLAACTGCVTCNSGGPTCVSCNSPKIRTAYETGYEKNEGKYNA